jgi:beta-lactam-binding protein with PASTA domain
VYVATGFSSMPMPNIIEMSWDQVLLIFASKGINVTINNVLTTDPDKDGKVVNQMPKEGDIVSSNVNVQAFVAVFGNEDVVKNTKFLLYSLDLRSLYNVEGVNYFIVKVVVSDSQGRRVITKEYQELTKLVLPLRIQGIGNVKVYINDTLVKESTL